jgi:hypothetical protein
LKTASTYRQATKLDVAGAHDACQSTNVDPTSLAASGPSLLKGRVSGAEIDRLANTLVRATSLTAEQQLEGLLTATVGPRLAQRLLDRRQVGERLSRVVSLVKNGAATAKLKGEQAKQLRRELASEHAVSFRTRLQANPSPAGVKAAIADIEDSLSANAIVTLVRSVAAKGSLAIRNAAEGELQRFAIKSELMQALHRTGDALQLRAIAPSELIGDEVLFLDAFDEFVHTNDAALKCIADASQFVQGALHDGDDFTDHSGSRPLVDVVASLKDEVSRMLAWHEALSATNKKKRRSDEDFALITTPRGAINRARDRVFSALDAATDELERMFTFRAHGTGYPDFAADLDSGHIPPQVLGPYDAFTTVLSKSKPVVDAKTCATVEELIRILHREVAQLYAEHVRSFVAKGLTLRRSHEYSEANVSDDRRLRMTYVGAESQESLAHGPMASVRDTVLDYLTTSVGDGYQIKDAILTDKTLAFDTQIGWHRGRLLVTYDASHELYFVEWGMQEPGSGESGARITFAKELFEAQGYTHVVDGYKHSASRKITPANIASQLRFMLFTLDNLQDVDISNPNLTPTGLRRMYESWDMHRVVDAKVDASLPLETKVAELARQDPHLFNVAANCFADSGIQAADAVIQFYGKHFDQLASVGVTAKTALADMKAVADHYFRELQEASREAFQPQVQGREEQDADKYMAAFEKVASDLALLTSRDDIREYFVGHPSARVLGPVYQTTD